MTCLPPAAFFSCSVCLFPAVPLSCRVSYILFSFLAYLQYCNNGTSIHIRCLPNVASSFSVSFHVLSPSRRVFIMQCLLPAAPPSCHASCTLFSFWYVLQYCNNGISLQIHCLPNLASSFSVSFHDSSPSRRVLFMLSLFPVVSLIHYSLFGMLYSTATMAFAFPFKFTAYLT
jgi:hypothetical protein